jgi:hypothetical protein
MKRQSKHQVCSTSCVVATGDHAAADLGGQSALLDLQSGVYFTLDPTGTYIWELMQTPRTVQEINGALAEKYGVSAETCEEDLLAFLRDLQLHGLLALATSLQEANDTGKQRRETSGVAVTTG